MDRRQCVDRLDLDHDEMIDQKVEPQADIQTNVAVGDRHANLPLYPKSPSSEFFRETGFIDRLQQARSQKAMHFQRGVNDDTTDTLGVGRQWLGPFVSFVHPS